MYRFAVGRGALPSPYPSRWISGRVRSNGLAAGGSGGGGGAEAVRFRGGGGRGICLFRRCGGGATAGGRGLPDMARLKTTVTI